MKGRFQFVLSALLALFVACAPLKGVCCLLMCMPADHAAGCSAGMGASPMVGMSDAQGPVVGHGGTMPTHRMPGCHDGSDGACFSRLTLAGAVARSAGHQTLFPRVAVLGAGVILPGNLRSEQGRVLPARATAEPPLLSFRV